MLSYKGRSRTAGDQGLEGPLLVWAIKEDFLRKVAVRWALAGEAGGEQGAAM